VVGVVGVRGGLMVMVMAVIRKKAERQNCSEWLVVIKGKMAQFQVNTQKKDSDSGMSHN